MSIGYTSSQHMIVAPTPLCEMDLLFFLKTLNVLLLFTGRNLCEQSLTFQIQKVETTMHYLQDK